MEEAYITINNVLVNLINEIWELEEKAIITEEFKDLSNNDMHVIEAVGLGEGKNISRSLWRYVTAGMGKMWYREKISTGRQNFQIGYRKILPIREQTLRRIVHRLPKMQIWEQSWIRMFPVSGRKNRCMPTPRGKRRRKKSRRGGIMQSTGKKTGIQGTGLRQGRHCRFPKRTRKRRVGAGICIRDRKRKLPAFLLGKRGT